MVIYQRPAFSPPIPCPYLPDRLLVYEYFFADSLEGSELEWLLSRGWRKFGHYYFRPACPGCQACTPLRIPVWRFTPSRSQQRVMRKCRDIRVSFGPIRYRDELFTLYCRHSEHRFKQQCSFDEFAANLHSPSCPSMLSTYELNGTLLGAGYVDQSDEGLSSVYFVFDPAFSCFSPGIFSVLREIEEARQRDLAYYYLGYVVPGCERMAYKARFFPHQIYSWSSQTWQEPGKMDIQPHPGTIRLFSG